MKKSTWLSAALLVAGMLQGTSATAGDGTVRLIQIGDIHGHLVPRPNVRSDSTGKLEGGLARMATIIKQIRAKSMVGKTNTSLLINSGDTVQGSAEALFTRGQALIDVVNLLGIDADNPGNWDFLYGTARFEETFKGANGKAPLANWHALASNLYYTNQFDDTAVCALTGTDPATGTVRPYKRVLPTYMIKQVGKVKVGILGFTTQRGIPTVGLKVTTGYQFTNAQTELPCFINVLRNQEKVDLLVMISELELSKNIKLTEANAGVDVVLSSDMHEKTVQPIVIHHANAPDTLLVEEGQDGTMVGEMKLEIESGKVAEWEFYPHIVTDNIHEDPTVAAKVAQVRKPFLTGTFVPGQQVTVGGNTTTLLRPVDEIIAYTQVDLHRSNFMDEDMPAVVEGSSHDLITDAMRWAAATDAASIRGFRYGTHVPAGWPIRMNDVYHYIPIAAKLGRSTKACGADLKTQVENSTSATFNPDPNQWAGGWMFGYNGVTFDLDACGGFGIPGMPTERGTNIKVNGVAVDITDAYNPTTQACASGAPGYKVAGYWYAEDPTTINNCSPCRGRLIQVVKTDGSVVDVNPAALPNSTDLLDVTEAVVKYLRDGLGGTVTASNLPIHRLNIKRLPTINPYPFKVIQPLNGATAATCPVL